MNKEFSIYDSPLSEDTKKIRRNLLIASSLCIFISITNHLPSSFALWGAKLDANQQPIVGWFIFSITAYLYLHFFASAGVEIAKWFQPFYEGIVEKRKLLKHPAFDETDWMEFLGPDDPHDLENVKKMAKSEAKAFVEKKLRHLYKLIYLKLTMEAVLPVLVGGYALIKLVLLLNNVSN